MTQKVCEPKVRFIYIYISYTNKYNIYTYIVKKKVGIKKKVVNGFEAKISRMLLSLSTGQQELLLHTHHFSHAGQQHFTVLCDISYLSTTKQAERDYGSRMIFPLCADEILPPAYVILSVSNHSPCVKYAFHFVSF